MSARKSVEIYNFTLISQFSGHDTNSAQSSKKYRPLFLEHFDKKENETKVRFYNIYENDLLVFFLGFMKKNVYIYLLN